MIEQMDWFSGDDTLSRARESFWANAVDEGSTCPCCDRFGRIYRRALNSGMTWWLIIFYKHTRDHQIFQSGFIDVREVKGGIERAHKCEFEKLAYWGLIEKLAVEKDEGHASGFWRITQLGRDFVEEKAQVLSHALDYNGGCRGLTGENIGIRRALRKKFDYGELMGGTNEQEAAG